MKIPLIWLKDYVDTGKTGKELAASFTALGLMLDKPLGADNVLDLEHRMDRADWLSVLGCARDLAAFEHLKLKLPKLYLKPGKILNTNSKIQIDVQTPTVRRFQTRIFKGIKVGPSPAWLKDRLTAYGMESKNNIVDITNFVMVEYGQTMHAQDLAKLPGKDITTRPAKMGEKVITLLGTEVKLDPDTFVLTSGGVVTVIGGIVGGKMTGVTDTTTNIILDAGNYDSHIIRKTSRRIKIINESVSRNDKFLDPRLIDPALARATGLILELAGGTYYDNDDYYPVPVSPKTMTLHLARLHTLSGMDFTLGNAKQILQSLGYQITEESGDSLTVEIPYFRTDVEVEDDLVADILRISNYENIPLSPLSTPVPSSITPKIYLFEEKLRDLLVSQGLHEHITSTLVTASDTPGQVKLANALSADQNALRTTLVPELTQVLKNYGKHNFTNQGVFEIGKTFTKNKKNYLEFHHLSIVFPLAKLANQALATLFSSLGIAEYSLNPEKDPSQVTITINTDSIGALSTTALTLDTNKLLEHYHPYQNIQSDFSHTHTLDLSIELPTSILFSTIANTINKSVTKPLSYGIIDQIPGKNNSSYLTLRLTYDETVDLDQARTTLNRELENMGIISRSK
jgi:phenylalanyl-tRNA synthetase beta chain